MVMRKRCETPGCKKLSVFNFKDGFEGRFCASHKAKTMVDVRHNVQCGEEGCERQVTVIAMSSKGKFCMQHTPPDWIVSLIPCLHANSSLQLYKYRFRFLVSKRHF